MYKFEDSLTAAVGVQTHKHWKYLAASNRANAEAGRTEAIPDRTVVNQSEIRGTS